MSRYDYYQWERQRDGRVNRRRNEKENSFYTKPNSDGIIEQQKQELPDIPTIKNDIEAAEKHAEDMVKER